MGGKITDVARAAGVSTATVSRVFSAHPYTTEDVRGKVFAAARELGYSPKYGSPQGGFALLLAGMEMMDVWPFERQLIKAVTATLFAHGQRVQIVSENCLDYLHGNSFKVAIAISSKLAGRLPLALLPTLTVNFPVEGAHRVSTDHFQGAALAVDHLVERGHRRVAFIGQAADNWGELERERGFLAALERHGLPAAEGCVQRPKGNAAVVAAAARVAGDGSTAVVAAGEGRGQLLNYALWSLGKRVPDDLSVVSFEDAEISPYLTPPQTTVSQDFAALGRHAAEAALEIAAGRRELVELTLPNVLVERMSVKRL